ncbi:MAG: nucleotidyl transferase AbiEii/AbiGii toxin family protein [Candidatus Magasanikbacteria bacterium]|nr:nucleotidyl transferase AbiEii/AbiGii toxin family protein [Candidatus Magasanikbacteria bacterium]
MHLEILDPERQVVWEQLAAFKQYGYLGGGTALALQIAHRYSYDLDIFCHQKISTALIQKCRKLFDINQVLINSEDEFTFLTRKHIKITFLHYPFVFHGHKVEEKNRLHLLNVLDIAASKAYTLNRRGNWRDYVDLFCILKLKKITLKMIIETAHKIYGEVWSEKLLLGQLAYTDDISKEDMKSVQFIGKKIRPGVIKNFFVKQVKEISKSAVRS